MNFYNTDWTFHTYRCIYTHIQKIYSFTSQHGVSVHRRQDFFREGKQTLLISKRLWVSHKRWCTKGTQEDVIDFAVTSQISGSESGMWLCHNEKKLCTQQVNRKDVPNTTHTHTVTQWLLISVILDFCLWFHLELAPLTRGNTTRLENQRQSPVHWCAKIFKKVVSQHGQYV